MSTQTVHLMGAVPRYSVLRWALGEDCDLWFTLRITPDMPVSRTNPCFICGQPARITRVGLPKVRCVLTVVQNGTLVFDQYV